MNALHRLHTGPRLLICLLAFTGTAHADFDFIRLADTATPVPGQPGLNFLGFTDPAIDGDTVVFRGRYEAPFPSDKGIYAYRPATGVIRLVDATGSLPGGGGTIDFVSQAPRIDGGRGTFLASDATSFEGIYSVLSGGGPLVPLADENSEVPGTAGAETFTKLGSGVATDASRVLFTGEGSGGTAGLYATVNNGDGNPTTVADTTTPIPGGGGALFTTFWTGFGANQDISGSDIVFIADGTVLTGIYSTDLFAGGPAKIADSTDPYPGIGGGTIAQLAYPQVSEGLVYFTALNAASNVATVTTDLAGSTLTVITDNSTIAPGTSDPFGTSIITAVDGTSYALLAISGGVRIGIYTNLGGTLERVTDTDGTLDGKLIDSYYPSNDNISGGVIVFTAVFKDGSSGVYAAIHRHLWLPNAGASWDNPANWTFGTLPRPVAPTFLTPTNGAIISGPTPATHLAELTIGSQSSGLAELALQPSGHLRVDGPLTIQPSGKLRVGGTVSSGAGLDNDGILAGSGQVDATLDNAVDAEVRVRTAESLNLTGAGNVNSGTMSVINGDLLFTQDLTNAASTGFLFAQDALLQFGAGLNNFGALATTFGNSTTFGDITNHPGATITLSGASTMTFIEDLLNNGAVQVSSGSRAVYFGTVSGTGSFPGGGVNCFEGDLRPGASPAQVHFGGHVEFGVFSEYVAEIGGTTPGSEYDRLEIAGSAQLAGTLTISLINGFPPALGDTFTILNASGGLIDTFAHLNTTGAPLGPDLAWQVNYTATSVQLEIISTLTPFEQWIATFPSLTNPADKTTTANPDDDLLDNLAEFALDDDPTSGLSSGKIVVKIAPVAGLDVLTLTLPVRLGANPSASDPPGGELALDQLADALRYAIQAGDLEESDGLATWPLTVTEVTGPDATAIQAGLPALTSGWEYRSFRSPGPVAGDPHELMRIRIEDLVP